MKLLFSCFLICLLTGCAAQPPQTSEPNVPTAPDGEEIALQVDGRDVPLWAYRYWLQLNCDREAQRCREAGETPDWPALREMLQQQAIADAALFAAVETQADRWGVTLVEEDRAQLDQLWQERCDAHGGEGAYLASLARRGLTADQARQLAETGQRYQALHRAVLEAACPYAPDEETLAAFEAEQDLVTADCIRTSGEDARHRIEVLFAALNAAPDPLAAFPGLAAQGEDRAGPRLLTEDSRLSPALKKIVKGLRPGQHSGILGDDGSFAIVERLSTAREALLPRWLDSELLKASKTAEILVLPALSIPSLPVQSGQMSNAFP